jgi:putative ABC transport system substrate-binding protein
MRRREFITLLSGVATWPLAARAQQGERVRRVGVLVGGSAEGAAQWLHAILRGLEELGWKQERNLRAEVRWGGTPDQLNTSARELLAWQPDVMVAFTNLALGELKPIAGGVPIVFVGIGDPVGSGFVASLARPGGNITGFESYPPTIGGKCLEVLKEAVPSLRRALTLLHPETAVHQAFWHSIEEAGPRLGIDVAPAGVHDAGDILNAISPFGAQANGAVIVLPHGVMNANFELIRALLSRHRLPSVGVDDRFLVSYAVDILLNQMPRVADYINRILRGANPADLPVQTPTKFELTVNLNVANALGITVPPALLSRADEVIE